MSDTELATDQVPDEETPAEESKPDREAAKYRTQLRAAEAEVAALRGQVRSMQRAELERVATTGDGPRLHRVADIWPDDQDTDLSELLDDQGRIDAGAVKAIVEAATSDRPYLRADHRDRRGNPSQGAGRDQDPAGAPSWSDVITRR